MSARKKPCRVCQTIRLFLVAAALLIVMMAFRPDAAIVLANLMPSAGVIGWIIGIMAVGLFVVKFIRWRRDP